MRYRSPPRSPITRLLCIVGVLLALLVIPAATAWAQAPPIVDTQRGGEPDVTNLEMWGMVVGFVLPPIIALIIQTGWPRQAQAFVTFLICLLAGAGTVYFQKEVNHADLAGTILRVFIAAIVSYVGFWKPTGISGAIERATTLRAPP